MHREETEDNSFTFPFCISVKNHITVCTYYNQSYSRCDRQASFICLCTHTHTHTRARARACMYNIYRASILCCTNYSNRYWTCYELSNIIPILHCLCVIHMLTYVQDVAGCHIHMRMYEANAKCHAVTKYAVNNITSQSFNISFVRNRHEICSRNILLSRIQIYFLLCFV